MLALTVPVWWTWWKRGTTVQWVENVRKSPKMVPEFLRDYVNISYNVYCLPLPWILEENYLKLSKISKKLNRETFRRTNWDCL